MRTRRSPQKQEALWREIGRSLSRASGEPTMSSEDKLLAKIQRETYFQPPRPPVDLRAEIQRARNEDEKADVLAEAAHMRLSTVESILRHQQPVQEDALGRLDRAASALSDARQSLGDAVYQLEKIVGE
jgi:hypothetical protein